MWPLERRRSVLRVGALRVERWVHVPSGWTLQGHAAMDGDGASRAAALEAAVAHLLGPGPGLPQRMIDVVLESAWSPVMLLEAGLALWSAAPVEALLRHRLAQLYGDGEEPVSSWMVQVNHRPGDALALGYGLPSSVKDALVRAAAGPGYTLASLQPALAWHLGRMKTPRGNRWCVIREQDRALLLHLDRGRVVALNPAVSLPADGDAAWPSIVEGEALRWGVASPLEAPIVHAWPTTGQVSA